jgi:hypothetical protein
MLNQRKIIVSLLALGAILISYQVGIYFQSTKQAQELGETNVKLLPLLSKPSDFNSKDISWEKVVYNFDILTFDKEVIGKAVSFMPGELAGNPAGFLFIHEIIVFPEENVPNNNPSEYYNPSPLSQSFPNIETSNESYCQTSELDYLSECSITVKNGRIISTFTIRIFEPNEQVALEVLPLAVEKFINRLKKSDLGN